MLFVELIITEKALSQSQRLLKSPVTPLTTDSLIASASPTLTAIEREHVKLIRYMIMLFFYFGLAYLTQTHEYTRMRSHALSRACKHARTHARTERERESKERDRERDTGKHRES